MATAPGVIARTSTLRASPGRAPSTAMGPVAGASTRGSSRGSQAPLYASHVSTTSSSPERTVIAGWSFGSSTVVNESRPRRFIVFSPHLSPHSLPHRGALSVQPDPIDELDQFVVLVASGGAP